LTTTATVQMIDAPLRVQEDPIMLEVEAVTVNVAVVEVFLAEALQEIMLM